MPAFIPINQPDSLDSHDGASTSQTLSLVRVEEEIRELLLEYQAALRQWAVGRIDEAYKGFEKLSAKDLVARVQDPRMEGECDAYCREYGGMGIDRLRSLVFANAGKLQMTSEGIQHDWHLAIEMDTCKLDALVSSIDPQKESALHGSLARLEIARAFDSDDMSYRLSIGQCAMLLGRFDIALSALINAVEFSAARSFAPSHKDSVKRTTLSQRWGPYQWWCVKVAVQAALMRGDADLAVRVAEQAAGQSLELPLELKRLLEGVVEVPNFTSIPPALCVPRLLPPSDQEASNPHCTIAVHAKDGRVLLAALGEGILSYFGQSIESDVDAGTNMFLTSVTLEICTESAEDAAGVVHSGEADANGKSNERSDTEIARDQSAVAAEGASSAEPDGDDSGHDCADIGEMSVPLKRVSSFSEDELPVKRRSTRFIERGHSTVVANAQVGTGGGTQSAPGARSTNVRGTTQSALSVSPEAAESEAFDQASERASALFGLVDGGNSSSEGFEVMLGKCMSLAGTYARQACSSQRSGASAQSRLDVDSDARSAWNLPADTGRGRGRTVVDFDEILRSAADMVGQYAHSLGAHLTKQEGDDTVNGPVTNVGYLTHSIEAEECVRLFVGNHGIFDVLLRYIGVVLDLLCLSPVARVPQTALKRVLLRTLIMTHEALLDQARNDLGSDSLDSQRRALHRGTAIVMLLTESAAVDTPCREQCACMRLEWKLVLGSAIARLQIPTSDTCVARYYVAEAWTNYEMAVWYNDLSGAAVAIGACYDLIRDLQGLRESLAGPDALLHTLSGVTVTLELVQQRQAHLDSFNKLGEAVRLAQSNESQAIDILSDLADPSANSTACSLVFPQKIAAVRLLAALCRRQSQAAGEVRAIMHELYLYLAQLLARSDDSVLPVRLVLRRCASCLKAIYAMASADGQINRDLESADVGLFGAQLASLLAAMLLALARHFTLDPETDSASTSPEATLVGLAAWLAAKLAFSPGVAFGAGTASRADRQTAADASDSPITQSSCPDDAEVLGPYLSYLDGVHALLGERGLCTAADGAFLKYVLEACRAHISEDTDAPVHWDVAGASLRCLFDIKLYNCKAPRHSSAHIEMDSISANLTYLLVESELLDTLRNRKGAGLRSDLKAIVDQTSSALSDIDATQHPRVAMNMDVIDDYLDGTAMPTFTQIERALRCEHAPVLVACLPPTEPGAGMPAACVTLPFVRATTQHDLLRFRMRSGMARAVEDYDDIIEDYKLHASLHPTSAEAWLHMGQAYSDLADELLLGTAAEIIECRHDIAVLQRAALACVVQAKQLLEPLSIGNDTNSADGTANTEAREQILRLHIRVYSLAGRLTYRIAARPLALLALGVLPSNILVANDDNSYQEWDLGRWRGTSAHTLSRSLPRRYTSLPPTSTVFKLACSLLRRASHLDSANWKWPYQMGKAVAKLGEPLAACTLYLKAAHLAAAADTSSAAANAVSVPGGPIPDTAIDPLSKLLSTLTKLLQARHIDATTAQRFIGVLPFSAAPVDDDSTDADGQNRSVGAASGYDPATGRAFATIRRTLEYMCASDKRRWHHRSVFWLAWMDHWLFGDSERAKQTLLTLLQMRNTNKQLASFYKTDFEAPGKHYLYLEKYLRLYIATLEATQDIDGLQLLARKLKRSAGSLYNQTSVVQETTRAETAVLLSMVRALNCPKFVADASGREHIVLQSDIPGADVAKTHAVFRHCRLNRTQFNYARDFARENIASFAALNQRVVAALSVDTVPESAAAHDELARMKPELEQYLDTANKAIAMFDRLLEQRKATDDPAVLSQLNDGLADLYVLVLSTYGQSKCTARLLAHHCPIDALVSACREATGLLLRAPHLARPEGSFWHCIIFDESRHESSQQYKLLDPLLEFQINKLIDSVRDARSQPPIVQ